MASAPFDVFLIKVSDRVGNGVRASPLGALLCESVSEKRRGAAFGLHRTLDQKGAIPGPLIVSVIMVLLDFHKRRFLAILSMMLFVRKRHVTVFKLSNQD